MTIILLGILFCLAGAQELPVENYGGIRTIDGYPLNLLRAPQDGTPLAAALNLPTPVPLQPESHRVIYHFIGDATTSLTSSATNYIIIEGLNMDTVQIGYVTPLTPTNIDCSTVTLWESGTTATPQTQGKTRIYFAKNWGTAAVGVLNQPAGLAPHRHMWPHLCLRVNINGVPITINPNLRIEVTWRCLGDAAGQDNQLVPDFGTTATINDANAQRYLCHTLPTTWQINAAVAAWGEDNRSPTSLRLLNERLGRTKCCGWRQKGHSDLAGNGLARRFGVCINPTIEACCRDNYATTTTNARGTGKPFNRFREKCCFGGNATAQTDLALPNMIPPEPVIINYLDTVCPCKANRVNDFCNTQYPRTSGFLQCCTPSKYPELVGTTDAQNQVWGKCFDPTTPTRCCNTGHLYDSGSHQCCAINGVQSVNVACPCSLDTHCLATQVCCGATTRPIWGPLTENTSLCNTYVNYPTGTGSALQQPCVGQCIDPAFQICCNGHICMQSFETCCNSTCCNKFSQRCYMGLKSGAPNTPANPYDFKIPYEICTTVEALLPFKAVLGWYLPICLLFATFVGLATTLFFAKRQNTLVPLTAYEKSMFTLACAAILFGWPLYFSPLWKYGVVTVWAAFLVILAALSQIRSMNVAALIVLGLLLIYLIDPFYGNEILTLAESRQAPLQNSVHGFTGVLHAIAMMYMANQTLCTQYYDFFARDPLTEDRLRWDNPAKFTFGFCQRDWYTTLGVLEVINLLIVFLLFFVTLITHIRNVLFKKAEKSEVVGLY